MAYVWNEALHPIFHFPPYNVVNLESSPKVPVATNLGISPIPKIVVKIIGSSYILSFFKQLDLCSILASLNLSLFAEVLFSTRAPPWSRLKQKASKRGKLISVQLGCWFM